MLRGPIRKSRKMTDSVGDALGQERYESSCDPIESQISLKIPFSLINI